MAVRIESQAEPLPGYRLIERLGGGGFGEVWKCEAPGGLHKAIKFVYGDLQAAGEDGARAEQELKALSRVKTVHHPYILSLERYDIIEGQLIIVMELADRTLWDRYRECREQGLPGMPREELLGYMAETAEALDLMNSLYQLQHLDIKPQNLFLVYNHVKVADFGLVKDLEGMMASVTGGVTPVYAAPETFDGWVSRFSDQYSLGIVYQELLTGQRPFTGASIRQLVLQHLQAAPDLSALPALDRPVIARVLAKKPEDRFPTCAAMVQALREAVQPAPTGAAPALPEAPREVSHSLPATVKGSSLGQAEDGDKTHGSPGQRNGSSRSREVKREPAPLPAPPATPGPTAPPVRLPPGITDPTPTEVPAAGTPGPSTETARAAAPRPEPTEMKGDGLLRPALVIGLGKHGLGILKRLRRELFEEFGAHDAMPHVRLLYLDSNPEALPRALGGSADAALRSAEVVVTKLHRPSHYLKPGLDGQQRLVSWLNPKLLYRMPRQPMSAGLRALGRLAFVDNYRTIIRRLQGELDACCNGDALDLAAQRTGLGRRTSVPRVYVATSLAGGTGSGMFLDVAYTVRHLLKRLGFERVEIVGVFLLPGPLERGTPAAPGLANAFAALTELNHFAAPDTVFHARYDSTDPQATVVINEKGPPFQRCILLPLPERRGPGDWQLRPGDAGSMEPPAAGPLGLAGRLLFTELATPLGQAAERARPAGVTVPVYQTFGMQRLVWPRRQLLQRTARGLCRRLVQRWMSKDTRSLREPMQQWVEAQWTELGLSADQLILRLQQACEKTLGQAPEALFAQVVAPLAAARDGKAGANEVLKPSAVVAALDELEQLLGIPEECRPNGPTLPDRPVGRVEDAVRQAVEAAKADSEQQLIELLIRLIEEPAFRLAGAEEAVNQFTAAVDRAVQHQEHLSRELQARAAALYVRLYTLLENPGQSSQGSSLWKTPFSRRVSSERAMLINDILELLRSYPKCRFQSLILHQLTGLYVSLRGLLSDQMREVGFCRQRLAELVDLFGDGPAGDLVAAAGRCLFSGGCASLREAVTQLDTGVSATDLLALDQRIQALLRKNFRALVHVCTATSNVIRTVAPAMQLETEAFLADRLGDMSVTAMYQAQPGGEAEGGRPDAAVRHDVVRSFDLADTALQISAGQEMNVLAVPPGPDEAAFRELVKAVLPDTALVAAESVEEIVFYREQVGFALSDLKQLGPACREVYQKLAALEHCSPHSRSDITQWRGTGSNGNGGHVAPEPRPRRSGVSG